MGVYYSGTSLESATTKYKIKRGELSSQTRLTRLPHTINQYIFHLDGVTGPDLGSSFRIFRTAAHNRFAVQMAPHTTVPLAAHLRILQ